MDFDTDHHLIVSPHDGALLASCQCGEVAPTATVTFAAAQEWYAGHWAEVTAEQ